MYCKYLSKCLNGNLRCKYKKQVITLLSCQNCSDFILIRNKPIKKVSNKKENVKKEIYQQVYNRDRGRCRLCGTTKDLQLHHIMRKGEKLNK